MRIGIDCRMYGSSFTGIGNYTKEIVERFIKLNRTLKTPHKLILFFNNPEYRKFNTNDKNIKKVCANAPHYSFKEQWTFYRALKKEKLDIVHFTHFNKPILYRKPYIVTIHDLTLTFFPGQKMTRFYHRLTYHKIIKSAVKNAKKVISVSRNTKKDIVNELKIPENKITVIYNGLSSSLSFLSDPKKTQKTLKKYKITKEFLLYTGVWRNHKNLVRLIKAFHILRTEKQLNLQLVITGKKDPYYPEIIETIKKFDLTKDVILTGLVPEKELNHLYNAALFYIFPSLYEGFGLPPLESMKCGTPVCASNISSIPEICGEKNAIYFDPYSTEDIAEKIYVLYKNAGMQAELVERGVKHAEKFSWEKCAKETFQLLCSEL